MYMGRRNASADVLCPENLVLWLERERRMIGVKHRDQRSTAISFQAAIIRQSEDESAGQDLPRKS